MNTRPDPEKTENKMMDKNLKAPEMTVSHQKLINRNQSKMALMSKRSARRQSKGPKRQQEIR